MIATLLRSFVVLSVLLLAASAARASCGDYLEKHEPAPAKPAPKPCDGPHCSQHQFPPIPPAPVPPPSLGDDSCCVAISETTAVAPRVGWLDIVECREPHFTPNELFDPPR